MQKTTVYEKKYSMTFKGDVQDVGFRCIIKDTAVGHNLDGEVFNHPDGDVAVHCGGKNGDISNFLEDLEVKGNEDGISFDITEMVELPSGFRLPKGFYIIDTDTPEDEQRKLEKGLGNLRCIKKDVRVIRDDISKISNNTSVLPGLVECQNKMLGVIERIEGKL